LTKLLKVFFGRTDNSSIVVEVLAQNSPVKVRSSLGVRVGRNPLPPYNVAN
jgi:hypothetical protein